MLGMHGIDMESPAFINIMVINDKIIKRVLLPYNLLYLSLICKRKWKHCTND